MRNEPVIIEGGRQWYKREQVERTENIVVTRPQYDTQVEESDEQYAKADTIIKDDRDGEKEAHSNSKKTDYSHGGTQIARTDYRRVAVSVRIRRTNCRHYWMPRM